MARANLGQVRGVAAGILAVVLCLAAPAAPATQDDFPADDLAEQVARVNEGGLRFLEAPTDRTVHHHHNDLRLSATSLEDGWARLEQCHEHMDAVPRAEVIFRPDGVRNLAIASMSGIERAWVEGPSVQLEGVGPGATLCVSAESRVLTRMEDGSYAVRNGPFMRRFLDGYYPMRVSMAVHYPCGLLRFAGAKPSAQPGFAISEGDCQVDVDAWFEGRLNTELRLEPVRTGTP